MILSFANKYFTFKCDYHSRHVAKDAGLLWSDKHKVWYTSLPMVASRLRVYADEKAKVQLAKIHLEIMPWTGAIKFPEGLVPLDFQIKTAVPFALSRNRSYLALDPGLGKTICAALVANSHYAPICYICPAFLVNNVKYEIEKWCLPEIKKYSIVLPDSQLTKMELQVAAQKLARKFKNAVLVIDEAHRFKTETALRSHFLFRDIFPHYSKIVFLSGTPMPNRPIELYNVLHHSAPETIQHMNKHQFAVKYCQAHRNNFGWDYTGASNIPELAKNVIGTFMLRLKKADVLKDLLPKVEQMVLLEVDMPAKLMDLDKKLLKKYSPEDLMKGVIGEEHVASYRRELGISKAKHVAKYIKFLLDDTDESVLLFGIHKDVIASLSEQLKEYEPLVITGDTPVDSRQGIVNAFQNGVTRLLILNIQAGGIGFNLTKATRVVFAEFSWCPSDNDQASDRAHRIGQQNLVTVDYLLYANSIDAIVLHSIFQKRKNINQI